MEIAFFIIVELIGLIPFGLMFLIKKDDLELSLYLRFRHYGFRALFSTIAVAVLFILFSNLRMRFVALSAILQVMNMLFFRFIKS